MRNRAVIVVCSIVIFFGVALGASAADFAHEMLAETNLARTKPHQYVEYLRDLRRHYEGKVYRVPYSTEMVMTSEGIPAVDEAIAFMEKQSPLPALEWSQGLADAAQELVREQEETGAVGHHGRSSGGMEQRIERHGTWLKRIGENIGYGPNTARLMVMELIIDDGVPGRGHRKNIFSKGFSVAGVACGPHPEYRRMCVMDFAGGFHSKGMR